MYCFHTIFFVYVKYCYNCRQLSFTAVARTIDKNRTIQSGKFRDPLFSVASFFGYLSFLPSLLTFAKKGVPGKMFWSRWERLCGACLLLSRGFQAIVQAIPRPCVQFYPPFLPSRVLFRHPLRARARKTRPFNCSVAKELRAKRELRRCH